MKLQTLTIVLAWILFFPGSLSGQGKYLNPAVEREMDKPVITASSTLPPGSNSNYSPDNLMDGTEASWSEGAKGLGIGEYLQVDFRFPDEMKYVMIKNGFGKEKFWKANARIKKMKISNEAGDTRIIVLEDTPDLQVIGLKYIEENKDKVMDATRGLFGDRFKFEILEVYPGERWQDACITEMNFNQWYTEWFPMPEDYIIKNLYRVWFGGVFDETGATYIESDWDGYVILNVTDGYVFEEIVSGDGTSGHKDFQIFINPETNGFYMLSSTYEKSLDYEHIDFNEEAQEEPVWMEKFLWSFLKYESFDDKFLPLAETGFTKLFDVDPIKRLSKSAKEKVRYEDIWVTIDEVGFMKFVFPKTLVDPKVEVVYMWDGSLFRLK